MLKSLKAVTNSETWSVGVLVRGIGAVIVAKKGNPRIGFDDLAAGYGIEAERVIDPDNLESALAGCKRAMSESRPCLVNVKLTTAAHIPGWDTTHYDYFSAADRP